MDVAADGPSRGGAAIVKATPRLLPHMHVQASSRGGDHR